MIDSSESVPMKPADGPAVTVITRTKDRPALLKRAALSVERQTFTDIAWIVVNDGGAAAAVGDAIAASGFPASRQVRIDLAHSVGMEEAANVGVRAAQGRYFVLHDDDDSWEPGFLAETVAFLDSPAGQRFAGVVTHATYVSEEVSGTEIVEHARGPYDPDLTAIAMADLLRQNLFPPISFLVRRAVWERVGGYDPHLAALGDWYFNVKVLFEADIAVLPLALANWHHRDRGASAAAGAAANSVIGAADVHAASVVQVRNQLVRDLSRSHGAGAAAIVAQLFEGLEPRHRTQRGAKAGEIGRVRPLASQCGGGPVADTQRLLRAAVDVADRRWVMAHLPVFTRMRLAFARRRKAMGQGPPAEMSWADLEPLLAKAHLSVPPDFDEAAYLAANRDVAAAVADGRIECGYTHWVRFGRGEGRLRPSRFDQPVTAFAVSRGGQRLR